MWKKVVSVCMVLGMLCVFHVSPVYALTVESMMMAQTEETLRKIDELYEMRAYLAIDYEKNMGRISKIEQDLADLGVERLSETEATQMLMGTVGTV